MGNTDGVGERSESGIDRHPSDEGGSKENVGRKRMNRWIRRN